ncbi:MAG: hypothetical protein WD068_02120 [Candidatus Babeliales bacterium]
MFNFLKNKLFGQNADPKVESVKKGLKVDQMTLDDFARQLEAVGNAGALKGMKIPGMPQLSDEQIKQGQRELVKFKGILKAMTLEERQNPAILDASRRDRIVKASGVKPADIDLLLQRFEQSKRFVKLFNRFGKK